MNPAKRFLFFVCILVIPGTGCKPTVGELINQAVDLNQDGQHDKAIAIYNKVIAENDQLQLAYYNRGFAYASLEKYNEALKDFTKVMTLQSNGNYVFTLAEDLSDDDAKSQVAYDDALYQRAQTLYHLDSLSKSFLAFQELIDHNYKHKANCILWQGQTRLAAGMKEEGCAYFEQGKLAADDDDDRQSAEDLISAYCDEKGAAK